MDNHKVVIDLTSKKVDPPIKFVKARNSKPTSSNFKFSPKMFPQLKNSVKSVKWNSAEKKLEVTMEELQNLKFTNG
jgi:hypothetical protein